MFDLMLTWCFLVLTVRQYEIDAGGRPLTVRGESLIGHGSASATGKRITFVGALRCEGMTGHM